jgi:hypothetical protein
MRVKLRTCVSARMPFDGSLRSSSTAQRALRRLAGAAAKVEDLSQELAVIEFELDATDPALLPAFKKEYSERGGEQFRPNEALVSCK